MVYTQEIHEVHMLIRHYDRTSWSSRRSSLELWKGRFNMKFIFKSRFLWKIWLYPTFFSKCFFWRWKKPLDFVCISWWKNPHSLEFFYPFQKKLTWKIGWKNVICNHLLDKENWNLYPSHLLPSTYVMAIRVVEFSNEGYKIKKIFA